MWWQGARTGRARDRQAGSPPPARSGRGAGPMGSAVLGYGAPVERSTPRYTGPTRTRTPFPKRGSPFWRVPSGAGGGGVTRPLPVLASAGQVSDRCWICWRPLTDYTGGEGRVYRGCGPCRAEIERLQGECRMRGPLVRRGPPVPAEGAPSGRRCHQCGRGELRHARAVARREGLVAAAKATGLNYSTLYGHARREGWVVKDGRA